MLSKGILFVNISTAHMLLEAVFRWICKYVLHTMPPKYDNKNEIERLKRYSTQKN